MNTPKPNIYHIIFDGFNSLVFLDALKALNQFETFNDFTFFKNNRANYDDTFASLPSMRTGNFYQTGAFKRWISPKLNPGIFRKIHKTGYRLNIYTMDRQFSFNNADFEKFYTDMLIHYQPKGSIRANTLKSYNNFTNYILSERMGKAVRLLLSKCAKPFQIKLQSNNGFPSFPVDSFLLSENMLSLPLILDYIRKEKTRPDSNQYNYAHIMLPHSPFTWTRSFAHGNNSYEEQVYCTIRLMNLLINTLKNLKRYKNALIIFHSDHGMSDVDFSYPNLNTIPNPVIRKIRQTINHEPTRFLHRSHALLLIKPPGTETINPLQISHRLTQLVDIPSTINHLLGLDFRFSHGASVFGDNWDENREIHMFAGLHKYNKLGLKCDFGKHFLSGNLAHLAINPKDEWQIYPDQPICWN